MDVEAGRYTAHYPDDFVVFFIGMRINHWWRVTEWVPVMWSAFGMVRELRAMPDSPLLESRLVLSVGDWRLPFFVQHWRSVEELEGWANDKDRSHKPAQREFFRRTAYNGHVGVWHETYRVAAGQFEAIYANMPRIGLAAAGEYRPLRAGSRLQDHIGDARRSGFLPLLPSDVAIAIDVLARRDRDDDAGATANLAGVCLPGSIILRGRDLSRFDLGFANLDDATLDGTVFRGDSLVGAVLLRAELRGADFVAANIDRSYFAGARNADLSGAVGTPSTLPGGG